MKTSSTYVRGNSLPVDRKLFGANRQNLISSLQKKHKSGLVLLKGGTAEAVKFYDTGKRTEGVIHCLDLYIIGLISDRALNTQTWGVLKHLLFRH